MGGERLGEERGKSSTLRPDCKQWAADSIASRIPRGRGEAQGVVGFFVAFRFHLRTIFIPFGFHLGSILGSFGVRFGLLSYLGLLEAAFEYDCPEVTRPRLGPTQVRDFLGRGSPSCETGLC